MALTKTAFKVSANDQPNFEPWSFFEFPTRYDTTSLRKVLLNVHASSSKIVESYVLFQATISRLCQIIPEVSFLTLDTIGKESLTKLSAYQAID